MNNAMGISWDDASPHSSSENLLLCWDEGNNGSRRRGSLNQTSSMKSPNNSAHGSDSDRFNLDDSPDQMNLNINTAAPVAALNGENQLSLIQQLQAQQEWSNNNANANVASVTAAAPPEASYDMQSQAENEASTRGPQLNASVISLLLQQQQLGQQIEAQVQQLEQFKDWQSQQQQPIHNQPKQIQTLLEQAQTQLVQAQQDQIQTLAGKSTPAFDYSQQQQQFQAPEMNSSNTTNTNIQQQLLFNSNLNHQLQSNTNNLALMQHLLGMIQQQNDNINNVAQQVQVSNTNEVGGMDGHSYDMAQAQHNVNSQINSQLQPPFNGVVTDNNLMQNQLQLLQTLQQQAQQQQQQDPTQQMQNNILSIESLTTTPQFQSQLAAQALPSTKPPAATKPICNKRKATTNSAKTKAIITKHRRDRGAIRNTMKSLQDTIKTVHYGMAQHGGLETPAYPPDNTDILETSPNHSRKHSLISGSMKSLTSTLMASALMVPPVPQDNSTWEQTGNPKEDDETKALIGKQMLSQNQVQQQDTSMMIHPSVQNNPFMQHGQDLSTTPTVTSNMNVVSSDTDGEVFAQTKDDPSSACDKDVDDVAKAKKERSRINARQTRLRKKIYINSLKQSIDELCRERDALISERANAANVLTENHLSRVNVLRKLFALRSEYDPTRELWSSILDENVTYGLPVTPYQSFPSSEVQIENSQRTASGVDAMIADAASNAVFFNSLDRRHHPTEKIKFQYTIVAEDSTTNNLVMARWSLQTLNARQCGASHELHQNGMLLSKFNSANKIVSLDITFDVMAFMLQVKKAMGVENLNDVVIPNTLPLVTQRQFEYPMVLTLACRPYTIVQVNKHWEDLTGYVSEDVVGKSSCSILQGPDTCKKELAYLMEPVWYKRASSGMITNYTKSRKSYRGYIALYPLSTDSPVSHYFGVTTFVQWIDDNKEKEAESQQQQNGDSIVVLHKRPREDIGAPSPGSPKSKLVKINENSSPSFSDGTSISRTIDLIATPSKDKQSLSSLTSSLSSSSTSGQAAPSNECDSVALMASSQANETTSLGRTLNPDSSGGQKVEFSDPLATSLN